MDQLSASDICCSSSDPSMNTIREQSDQYKWGSSYAYILAFIYININIYIHNVYVVFMVIHMDVTITAALYVHSIRKLCLTPSAK